MRTMFFFSFFYAFPQFRSILLWVSIGPLPVVISLNYLHHCLSIEFASFIVSANRMKDNGLLGEYKIRERTKVRHMRHTHQRIKKFTNIKHAIEHVLTLFSRLFCVYFVILNRPWSHVIRQPVHITFCMWTIRTVMVASSQLFITWIFIGMLCAVAGHSGIVH